MKNKTKQKLCSNHLASESDRKAAVLIRMHSREIFEKNLQFESGSISKPARLLVFKVGLSDDSVSLLYAETHFCLVWMQETSSCVDGTS